VTLHAVQQCQKRKPQINSLSEANDHILRVIQGGVGLLGPFGPAIRCGLDVVGIQYDDPKHPEQGMVAVTFYEADQHRMLKSLRKAIKGPFPSKPGRKAAWNRLYRQGKNCRRPPTQPSA